MYWSDPILTRKIRALIREDSELQFKEKHMVNHVTLPDGSVADGTDVICDGCGSNLADHSCGGSGAAGSTGSVTYARRTGPRAPVASIPSCVHCGGRIHQNLSGIAVNDECITRQYALDQGLMTDPNGRLPIHLGSPEGMGDIATWAASLSTPITYGKMLSSAGGAGTYAGLRPKTGRKKKIVAAAPGAQIQDMADEEAGAVVSENGKAPAKPKRVRKGKVTIVNPMVGAEEIAILVPEEEASNGYDSNTVPETDEAAVVAPEATSERDEAAPDNGSEAARQSRAERRAAVKAKLAASKR